MKGPATMIRHVLPRAALWALLFSVAPLLAEVKIAVAQLNAAPEQPRGVDVKAFEQVKIPVASAITAANKHTGGKVIEASFYVRNGKPVYKVKTYQDTSTWEGLVDAQTGQVIGAGRTRQESQLDAEDKAELEGLRRATITLTQAVTAAEKQAAGKAITAGIEQVKGKIVYEVMTVKDGSLRKTAIDPQNGKILN